MKNLEVLYTTDHFYINYLLVSLYSLLEQNKDLNIKIHIIFDKFIDDDFSKINKILEKFPNSNICFYDFNEIAPLIDELKIPTWRNVKIPNARLFFSNFIKVNDYLLYLDSDTIIVNSLKNLANYNKPLHMVKDSMPKSYWQNLSGNLKNYYNSGVQWINVPEWIDNNFDAKLRDVFNNKIPIQYPDQDAINIALQEYISPLPLEYNLFSIDYFLNSYFLQKFNQEMDIVELSKEEIKNAKKHPIILHATPFFNYSLTDNHHPYYELYSYYNSMIFDEKEKEKSQNNLALKAYLYTKLAVSLEVRSKVKKFLKITKS